MANVKILYVEDNEDNVYMLSQRLARRGYAVLVARDGEHGVAMAEAEMPALILMDLSLPVLDGWQATCRLKSSPLTARIPVIALSSHAMAGEREAALAAGCDEFEAKPIDFQRLIEKIQALLGRGPDS
jgi:CheY-like chemotaxis protein